MSSVRRGNHSVFEGCEKPMTGDDVETAPTSRQYLSLVQELAVWVRSNSRRKVRIGVRCAFGVRKAGTGNYVCRLRHSRLPHERLRCWGASWLQQRQDDARHAHFAELHFVAMPLIASVRVVGAPMCCSSPLLLRLFESMVPACGAL